MRRRKTKRRRKSNRKRKKKGKKKRKSKRKRQKKRQQGSFLDVPGLPKTSVVGAPELHFETLGFVFGHPGPQGRQRSTKGPQMKKESTRQLPESTL